MGSCQDKKSERVENRASTQLVGSCHDKKSELVGDRASTQLVGSCHDEKSEQAGCIASTQQDSTFQLIVGFKQCHQSLTPKSQQRRLFVDNVLINFWQRQMVDKNEMSNLRQCQSIVCQQDDCCVNSNFCESMAFQNNVPQRSSDGC